MYERITTKCRDLRHVMVLSRADKTALSLIGERLSGEDSHVVQNVFLRAFRNRAAIAPRLELARAVGEAVRALDEDADLLPYMYSFAIHEGPLASTGAGAVAGIRMPGDDSGHYSLRAGLGVCKLERRGAPEDRGGSAVDVRDCRGLATLPTSNCGDVILKRRKVDLRAPGLLKELGLKLDEWDRDDVSLSYEEFRRAPPERSES